MNEFNDERRTSTNETREAVTADAICFLKMFLLGFYVIVLCIYIFCLPLHLT